MMAKEQLLALLPLLVLAATIVAVMLFIAIRRNHWWNATLAVVGLNAALATVVYNAFTLPPVVELTTLLILDPYAAFYMGLLLVTTLACTTMSHAYMEGYKSNREELYLLLLLAALGAVVLACSRHLTSLFIGLELLSVPVYGMVAYTFRNPRTLEGGMKYMVLSATASAMLLFGMALIYAVAGTLSFSGLAYTYLGPDSASPLLLAGTALMIAGLAFKLSIAPFHIWTPDVYEGAPAPVGAFLATASKTAVFAVLVRFLYESGALQEIVLRDVLAVLAGISIVVGNLLALMQSNIKRLLAYSSIAHFGYLLIPLVAPLGTPEAVGVYLITYVVTTLGAFGVVALMSSPYTGHDADQLHNYRGMFWKRPYLTAVMTGMMLSLAGIPVTAGFIGKFYIVAAGVSASLWVLMALVVIGSAIGLYYYLRVMVTMYLPAPGMNRYDAPLDWGERAGGVMILGLTVLMFVLGMYPQPFLEMIRMAMPAVIQ
ncbi:MAG: NADH:ubiquinone oxidoreductase subunit [Moraxellaceae bacterium]|jgi:NADH-quinone oxidoreductase subunit N|nr:NADH:ubiquinone oxidoreductase subunit [Moraxellaceae bacterium]